MRLTELAAERNPHPPQRRLSKGEAVEAVSTAHLLREELREALVDEMRQVVRGELAIEMEMATQQAEELQSGREEWREAFVESNKQREALQQEASVREGELLELRQRLAPASSPHPLRREALGGEDAARIRSEDSLSPCITSMSTEFEEEMALKTKIIMRLRSALLHQSEEVDPLREHGKRIAAQLAEVQPSPPSLPPSSLPPLFSGDCLPPSRVVVLTLPPLPPSRP